MVGEILRAVWPYEGQEENELRFTTGQVFKLVQKHNDDWWEGEINGKHGLFPANHVEIIQSKRVTLCCWLNRSPVSPPSYLSLALLLLLLHCLQLPPKLRLLQLWNFVSAFFLLGSFPPLPQTNG